jgi:type I restriction enzyme S subunit
MTMNKDVGVAEVSQVYQVEAAERIVPVGYKQTEIGVMPADWIVTHLSNVAEIRGGIAKNSKLAVIDSVEVNYLSVANVQDGYLNLSIMNRIVIKKQNLKRYSVLPGDVLMNEGGDLDKLGRGAVWSGEIENCVHQNHVFVVRSTDKITPKFLNIWTSGNVARRFF